MEVDPTDKSRQKSCNACVRSKRRCDKRTPKCTRCAEKNFSCLYQNLPNDSADGEPHHKDAQSAVDLPAGFDQDFQLESHRTSLGSLTNDLVMVTEVSEPLDIGFDFNSMFSFLTADQGQNNEMQLWQVPEITATQGKVNPTPINTPSRNITLCRGDYPEMDEICEDFQPWQVHEPQSKIGYLVTTIKSFHTEFARDKATPFMHRYLYRHNMPRSMLHAYTSVTAYANRTDANKDWAIRVLCESVSELTRATAVTPYEKLARVHALFMYQTIRCFDGDVTLRALAENDMPLFNTWLEDLETYRDNMDELWSLDDLTIRQRQPKSWERWIFSESVRRTILMAYAFTTMYEMLKSTDACNEMGPWQRVHRWTTSQHLWNAESTAGFFAAWRDKPQFFVQNFTIEGLTKFARPGDVDDFARILLTANLGVEGTKHFLAETAV